MKSTLSPKELALAIGVSESSLKRWVDEGAIQAGRTSGGHRRITLAEAVRFIRETGIPIVRSDILGLTDLDVTRIDEATRQVPDKTLQEALLAGKAPEARGIIMSLYLAGHSPAEIWDQAIAKAMRHVGTLWKHESSGIYIEHLAPRTSACRRSTSCGPRCPSRLQPGRRPSEADPPVIRMPCPR